MYSIVFRFLHWVLAKAVFYFVIVALLLIYFIIRQLPDIIIEKQETVLAEQITAVSEGETLLAVIQVKLDKLSRDIARREQLLATMHEDRSKLEGLWPKIKSLLRRKALAQQRAQLDAWIAQQTAILQNLRSEFHAMESRLVPTGNDLERRKAEVAVLEQQLKRWRETNQFLDSLFREHLRLIAWGALKILAVLVLLPVLWKVLAFYVLAPLVHNAKPVNLGKMGALGSSDVPDFLPSAPSISVKLECGDVLLLRENFLQSSTENSAKRTQWLVNWSYPFTSLASGLFMLTSIRAKNETSADICHVTLSCQKDTTLELSAVNLPAGKTAVFRPLFLAALRFPEHQPPNIRSAWVFNRLHCWVNLRFRFLTIQGPVQLFFAAQRGIQMETVQPATNRRINSNLTVAYSPQLDHSPRRAETFIAYFRGANPLFDDFFAGDGLAFNQQVAGNRTGMVRSMWQSFFNAFQKVFGL
jgi:hypothetical protein